MSKKFIIGAIVLAIAASYPIASKIHGDKADEKIHANLQKINAQLSEWGIKNTTISYQKTDGNIFRSEGIFSVQIDGKTTPVLQQTIEHGPFPLSRLKEGKLLPVKYQNTVTLLNNEETAPVFAFFQQEQPFSLSYTYDYQRKIKGDLHVNEVFIDKDVDEDTQFMLTMGKSTTSFDIARDGSYFAIDSQSDDPFSYLISFTEHQHQPRFFYATKGINTQLRYQKTSDNNVSFESHNKLGNLYYEIDNLAISVNSANDKTAIQSSAKETDFSSDMAYDSIKVGNTDIGSVNIDVSLAKLDRDSLNNATNIIVDIFKTALREQTSTATNRHINSALFPLGLHLLNVLQHSPEMGYGPITHSNKGGKASIALQTKILPPSITGSSEDQLLSAISDTEFMFSFEKDWLAQLAFDVYTIVQEHEGDKVVPDAQQKIKAEVETLLRTLLKHKLVILKDNTYIFSVKAIEGNGRSLKHLNKLVWNDEKLALNTFAQVLKERWDNFINDDNIIDTSELEALLFPDDNELFYFSNTYYYHHNFESYRQDILDERERLLAQGLSDEALQETMQSFVTMINKAIERTQRKIAYFDQSQAVLAQFNFPAKMKEKIAQRPVAFDKQLKDLERLREETKEWIK